MKIPRIVNLLTGLLLGLSLAMVMSTARAVTWESKHVFTLDDVMGGFDGKTFGPGGTSADNTILCGAPGAPGCPQDISPITDTKLIGQAITLYPIDSEFGYHVVDFLGAVQKSRDNDYLEGFVGTLPAGNVPELGDVSGGVAVSNQATDTYKVKPPLGTWCRGLGGLSVKCETEHYTVMEHVLTCHEVIPYFFADPLTGVHEIFSVVGVGDLDCGDPDLDDLVRIISNGVVTEERLVSATPCEEVGEPADCQIFPNDKTDMLNNIAVSSDYSVQLKDDGKALYGWGGMHKRPNDVRLLGRLALPDAWKEAGANFVVNEATLVVRHYVTNNPNDQLRPEDLENEAATGRKPQYIVEGEIDTESEVWLSTKNCFEGDGDYIGIEEGAGDPTPIDAGTYFKNSPFALTDPPFDPDPYALSADLREALTNAWYTTVDRDPFEWSYDADPDPTVQQFVGFRSPDEAAVAGYTLDDLVSGPRWRLTANKYGQDLPGLEIAIDPAPGEGTDGADCYAPPFEKELIKYNVGEPIITTINLLDWEDENGPLASTRGWVDVTQNDAVEIVGEVNGFPITGNGVPMTEDLELVVYIKGDRKATGVYDATLNVVYDETSIVLVDVPEVVGLTEEEAVAAIEANALVADVSYAPDDLIPAGEVISQDPLACVACAVVDSAVSIVVSTGPADCLDVIVPNVEGLSQAEAEAAITDAGLLFLTSEASDEVVPEGDVISQDPAAGACVLPDSTVSLVISTGPAEVPVDVIITALNAPNSTYTNRNRNVRVTILNGNVVAGAASGIVTLTDSAGYSSAQPYANLADGLETTLTFAWTSPALPQEVELTATVTVGETVSDTASRTVSVRLP